MLSPTDIKNKKFRRSFFGYDCKEVDAFLEMVYEDYKIMLQKDQWSIKGKIAITKDGRRLLSALEIHNKEFRRVFRGYDTDEVNEFLDLVIKDVGSLAIEKKEANNL